MMWKLRFEGASVAFEQQSSMRKSPARPCFSGNPQADDGSSTLKRLAFDQTTRFRLLFYAYRYR
ncbi:hypothetical protein, partial [Mesorhizobium sp.]|uniref:hypothetical protein n=1 Tax=Mesorhizobium sp. TaxID=1871066 RepID=UPI002579FE64